MKTLRIAYLGGRILGLECLKILHTYGEKIEVPIVISLKNDGEKNSDWNPPILPIAHKFGFKTFTPSTLSSPEILKIMKKEEIDVILNVFCNRIIPKDMINIPRYGCINFHYGKLPKFRGRFIVTNMIMNNEKETVATAHYIEEGIDTGDIIYEKKLKILTDDTAKTLYFRCTVEAINVFKKIVDDLIAGHKLPRHKQKGRGKYYSAVELNNCQVDLRWSKKKIETFIRAVSFEPISKPWIQIGNKQFDIIIRK